MLASTFIRSRKLPPLHPRSGSSCRLSQVIVKSQVAFDPSTVPNIPLGKFLFSNYESNSHWRDNVVMLDGTTGYKFTVNDAYETVYRTASALRNYGIRSGHGVAVMTPNHLNFFSVLVGMSLTEGHTISINPTASDEELLYQLELADAKMIFVHPLFMKRVLPIAEKLCLKVVSIDAASHEGVPSFNEFIKNEVITSIDKDSFLPKDFDSSRTCVVPFSSGTTGKSKGVMLTHKNLISNILQFKTLEPHYFEQMIDGKKNVSCVPLPFFHIFGMMVGVLFPVYSGALSISMATFDLQRFLEIVQEHKVGRAFVVPPIVLGLVKHPMVAKYDIKSLNALVCGAAPLSADLRQGCIDKLNCKVKNAWGLTETSPGASMTTDDKVNSKAASNGSAGQLFPGTEGKVVDPETGADKNYNEEGEILVRGPQVMKGYIKNPDATSAAIRPDGWFHSGDVGHFDDEGFLFITDRCKELIKYKGFQVPPAELEAILLSMPQLKDAIVIPVRDDEAGEIPRAYVVKQDNCPESFTEQDVLEFVNSKVSPPKKLRGGVRFTTSIPKSPAGKLLRRIQVQIDRGEIKA